MSDENLKARSYETLYPGTGCPEPQKQERMERIELKRRGRTRGVLIPALPWQDKED